MSETRFCGACGQSNSVDARFCGRCGAPLAAVLPAAPVAAPVAPAGFNKTLAAASIDPQALAAHVAAIRAAEAPALPPAPVPAAPVPAAALPSRAEAPMNTMLGASFDPSAHAAPAPDPLPVSRPRVHYATMIDPPREASSFDAAHRPPEPAEASKPAMKTMMGVAFTGLEAPPASEVATTVTPVIPDADLPPPVAEVAVAPAPLASADQSLRPRDQIMKTMLGGALTSRPTPSPIDAGAQAPISPIAQSPQAPIAQAPIAQAPIAQAPIAQAPIAQAPIAQAPIAQAPVAQPIGQAPQVEAATEGARRPMRTMLGMSFDGLPPIATSPPAASPVAPAAPLAEAPIAPPVSPVGPTLDASAPEVRALVAAEAAAGPTEVAPAPAAPRKQLGPSNRTMLGVIAPAGMIASAQAAAEARPPSTPPPPSAPAPVVAAPYTSAHAPEVGMSGDMSIAGMPSPRRRVNAALVVVLLLGLFLVVGATAAFFVFGGAPSRVVTVTPAHAEAGEVLRVEVPGIPDGYRARFAGTELPLAAARAEFPLVAESLHVGDNALTIDLVGPGGEVETHQVTLTLTYRVRADLGALAGTPPAIVVVVEALPGSTAVLDGQPLPLDATGRATRSYPLEGLTATAEGLVEHVAHYTITPAGTPAAPIQGTLTTRVPLTTMHLDRPGDDAVTDQDGVEIAGAVLAGASLTIDGAPVTVLPEGRFLFRYPLPAPGEFSPRIVATAPNRAPAVRTLHVRRVADLAREAATFTYDRTLTYARLATAPTTFASQRVMFEGRVYNVDVHDGRGVLQMLVRDCPAGQRCPLWVSYAAAVDVTVESWVRIYGTVEGEQQFRSTTGEIRTVPSVNATFVLPARP